MEAYAEVTNTAESNESINALKLNDFNGVALYKATTVTENNIEKSNMLGRVDHRFWRSS